MAYKSQILVDTPTAYVAGEVIGSKHVGINTVSADKLRSDAKLSVGNASDINLETYNGYEWIVVGGMAGTTDGTYFVVSGDNPLGSIVRLRVNGISAGITVDNASITCDR
jgi:hypothetical protein